MYLFPNSRAKCLPVDGHGNIRWVYSADAMGLLQVSFLGFFLHFRSIFLFKRLFITLCVCVCLSVFRLFFLSSLLLHQSTELQQRAVCCPGFLHTAVRCYISLMQLFLEGHGLRPSPERSDNQVTEPQKQIVSQWWQCNSNYWHCPDV